jgi:RHS repeat-associated protein
MRAHGVSKSLTHSAAAASLLTGLGIDEYFVRTDPSGASAFSVDALGSTVALTDAAGVVQTQYTYDPFGATVTTGAASSNPFQYTGRENDGTGLYYYRARYYHPGLQRFISEDPIGSPTFWTCPAGLPKSAALRGPTGNRRTDAENLYAYVRNRPTVLRDPSGLGPCEEDARACLGSARDALFQCRKSIFEAGTAAAAGCVPLCALAAPVGAFVPCFLSCEAIAGTATGAGLAACSAIALTQRGICAYQYFGCKEARGEPIVPGGRQKDVGGLFP